MVAGGSPKSKIGFRPGEAAGGVGSHWPEPATTVLIVGVTGH